MKRSRLTMLLFAIMALSVVRTIPAHADVRLPIILASHMVLQQNANVKIWGWADVGETVHVKGSWLHDTHSTQTTTADADGQWHVTVKTGPAGGLHQITITGRNTIKLTDILFGEVWLASGQSNMEMPLVQVSGAYTGIQNSADEVAAANHPHIRLFQAGNFSSDKPLDDVQPGIEMYGVPLAECRWQPCTPETIPTFSSTAYFFARELHRQLNVPIGIIDSSWGGTSAQAWTPLESLKQLGRETDVEQATKLPQKPDQKIPSRLYNGMIHPLRNFHINGAIWYQGEGNAGEADKYHTLFSTMIRSWRNAFDNDFSFYFVQLAPFNYRGVNSAFLREAQLQTLSLPRTGMAVTLDIGHPTDIHPKNKQEVGRRLALWALANDYNKDIVHSGPLFRDVTFNGPQAVLTFDHIGTGLTTTDGQAPTDFEIAGQDQIFHPATASIVNNTIIVSSDDVAQAESVRFAFNNHATPNLINREGLPASSFRTDNW